MTNEELTTWFNEQFWVQYQSLVKTPFPTKYKAGAKGEALKRIILIKPSEVLRQRILSAVIEQRKHRKKLYEQCGSMQKYLERTGYDKFYANRMGSTWLNQMGYEDEIPALDEMEKEGFNIVNGHCCKTVDCGSPVHGPNYSLCAQCLTRTGSHNEELKSKLREMGLGKSKDESVHDYAMRCKQVALKTLRGLKIGL